MSRPLILALAATATLLCAGAAQAGGVQWSIGINVPAVTTVISNAPVYYRAPPQVVYQQPAPVYYEEPAPVYYEPPQVVYRPVPRYYAPAPVVYVRPVPVFYPRHHEQWEQRDREWERDGRKWHHRQHDEYGNRFD